jgi:hypothetical protein
MATYEYIIQALCNSLNVGEAWAIADRMKEAMIDPLLALWEKSPPEWKRRKDKDMGVSKGGYIDRGEDVNEEDIEDMETKYGSVGSFPEKSARSSLSSSAFVASPHLSSVTNVPSIWSFIYCLLALSSALVGSYDRAEAACLLSLQFASYSDEKFNFLARQLVGNLSSASSSSSSSSSPPPSSVFLFRRQRRRSSQETCARVRSFLVLCRTHGVVDPCDGHARAMEGETEEKEKEAEEEEEEDEEKERSGGRKKGKQRKKRKIKKELC